MDNPIKANVSVSKILGWIILAFVCFALADATGLTGWILYPWTTAKAKFFPAKS